MTQRIVVFIGLFLVCFVVLAQADNMVEEVVVQFQPAWNGYYRPNHPLEISAFISGNLSDDAILSIRGGDKYVTADKVKLHNGQYQQTFALKADMATSVSAALSGQKHVYAIAVQPLPVSRSVLAVLTKAQVKLGPGNYTTIYPSLHSLPTRFSSYLAVDAVLIDSFYLAQLSPLQLAAFSTYLAWCGPVILAASTDGEVINKLKRFAGCQGQNVKLFKHGHNIVYGEHRDITVFANQVAKLDNHDGEERLLLMVIFFLLAGLFISFLTIVFRWQLLIYIFPILASIIAIVLWSYIRPVENSIVWTEGFQDQEAYRQLVIKRHLSTGTHSQWLISDVNASLNAPDFWQTSDGNQWRINSGKFYHSQTVSLTKTITANTTLYLTSSTSGLPIVINRSQRSSKASYLLTEREVYTIPALQPAQSWSPAATDLYRGDSAFVEHARKRKKIEHWAVLIPQHISAKQQQWLALWIIPPGDKP